MFAIIRTGGKQYRVREGDQILVERLDAPEGSDITIDDVLLVDRDGTVSVGSPNIEGASVAARVNGHLQGDKVLVFKYKNKTRRRQLRGHRQQHTRLTITSITAG
jgi:large subunit ribosomal protein L21